MCLTFYRGVQRGVPVANRQVLLGQHLFNPQVMKRDINADEGCPSFTRFSPASEKAVVLFKSEYLNSGAGADSDDELPFKCAIAYPNLAPVPVLLEIANEVQKQ